MMKKTETTAKNLAFMIASKLHDDWRKSRLIEEGVYEPRWKTIKDELSISRLDKENLPENIRLNEDVFEIDIANSAFVELTPDWQKENYDAALVCVDIMFNSNEYHSKEEIGEKIHQEWLKRNEWGREDEILSKPFEELPVEEQDKDLNQFKIAREVYKEVEKELKSKDIELDLF